MDKKRSYLNISTAIISRILLLLSALYVRRLLILYIGNDVNGLNSLYTSIIGMLALAELGIGSAMTYSMYKPIVDSDERQVSALYQLYKRLYRMIGAVIFIGGLIVLPFLPKLISDYEEITINVYIPFLLTLISVVLTYLYGAKTSLIQAHKNNYITTGIVTIASLIRFVLQIITILIWQSFTIYLFCQIIETLIIWLLTELVVRKLYSGIITEPGRDLDKGTKAEITKNIKAMFMHKVGTVLVNTIDSLIISAFIGVVILGKYSNYTLIISVIAGTITLFFTPLTSVVGHLCAAGDVRETKRWFERFYSLNYFLGVIFFLGYYAVIDPMIRVLFGSGLEVSRSIVFIITLNQFTTFMRKTALLFRDASGAFYYDRWKPIGEGIVNLVLSLLFVQIFPEDLRIVGVIVATIITTLFICHIVDPYVVFKYAFKMPVREYYIRNYSYIALFTLALVLMTFLTRPVRSPIIGILANGLISLCVSLIILGVVAIADRTFRRELCTMGRKVKIWSGRVMHDRH